MLYGLGFDAEDKGLRRGVESEDERLRERGDMPPKVIAAISASVGSPGPGSGPAARGARAACLAWALLRSRSSFPWAPAALADPRAAVPHGSLRLRAALPPAAPASTRARAASDNGLRAPGSGDPWVKGGARDALEARWPDECTGLPEGLPPGPAVPTRIRGRFTWVVSGRSAGDAADAPHRLRETAGFRGGGRGGSLEDSDTHSHCSTSKDSRTASPSVSVTEAPGESRSHRSCVSTASISSCA